VVAAEGNRGEDVFFVARNYDADRDLAIIRAVGCVEGAASLIEANFSAKMAAERGLKRGGIELRGMDRGWGNVLGHRVQNIFEDVGVERKGDWSIPESSPGRARSNRSRKGRTSLAQHRGPKDAVLARWGGGLQRWKKWK
jgi:hypothetical protein